MMTRCRRGNSWRSRAKRVDELVLPLARHEAADADHELAVDAETLAQTRGLLVARRLEGVDLERRTQDLGRDSALGLLARRLRRVLAHREQHGGVAEDVAQSVVHAGDHARQGDLGAAEEDDVRDAVPLPQTGTKESGRQRMAELDELRSLALGHLLHGVQHGIGGPEHRRRSADDGVRVGGVEGGGVDVRRREDRHLGGIQGLDDAPVVRLGAADTRGEVVGDEERARRSVG